VSWLRKKNLEVPAEPAPAEEEEELSWAELWDLKVRFV
jgi:hypothetical protein